jgi:hypothetical protein
MVLVPILGAAIIDNNPITIIITVITKVIGVVIVIIIMAVAGDIDADRI